MRKRVIGSIVACAAVGLAFFGLTACDKTPAEGGTGETPSWVGETKGVLDKIDVNSISVEEQVFSSGSLGTVFSWDPVKDATGYVFTCNNAEARSNFPSITLQSYSQFTLPSDGVFNVSIGATAPRYTSSEPVNYTYTVRGCELNAISVTSFEGGILKWEADPLANGYLVSVNGGADIAVNTNELNLSGAQYSGAVTLSIRAAGDGLYTKNGTPITFRVNAAHTRMHLLPVTSYTVNDGVISWEPVAGAAKYRVVDIERNSTVVNGLSYDYSESLPVYGVYPVSDNDTVYDAEITPVDIPYLKGQGTHASPYEISSPLDFRAIDYYEAKYAERRKTTPATPITYYYLTKNIDFNAVGVIEEESNFYALTQPFYGNLMGNGKALSNIRIRHNSGYWAMFDYIAPGGAVMNMTFVSPDIKNAMIQPTLPINASIATVAHKNYGTISNINVTDANYQTAGGEIAGICWDNHGTVQHCEVSGVLTQKTTGQKGQACYEMAGIVAENNGTVTGNKVSTLEIRGSTATGDDGGSYNVVRCAAGIVSVNRAGGTVSNNSFYKVTMSTVNITVTVHEFGGICAYNAGTVIKGTGSLGTFIHNGKTVNPEVGSSSSYLGTLIGKNEGTRS